MACNRSPTGGQLSHPVGPSTPDSTGCCGFAGVKIQPHRGGHGDPANRGLSFMVRWSCSLELWSIKSWLYWSKPCYQFTSPWSCSLELIVHQCKKRMRSIKGGQFHLLLPNAYIANVKKSIDIQGLAECSWADQFVQKATGNITHQWNRSTMIATR